MRPSDQPFIKKRSRLARARCGAAGLLILLTGLALWAQDPGQELNKLVMDKTGGPSEVHV